jgi:hypothetical protein
MKKLLFPIIIFLLCSCSPTATTQPTATATVTPIPQTKPDDFQVQYTWETGSLPPPYFYAYTITLGPEAKGEISFVPGYSNNDPPRWIETWDLAADDLDQLYAILLYTGAFTKDWSQLEDIPTGGSADKLLITAYGQQFSIPSYVAGEQQAKDIRVVYNRIGTLVPQAIWNKLEAQHEEYVEAHENED